MRSNRKPHTMSDIPHRVVVATARSLIANKTITNDASFRQQQADLAELDAAYSNHIRALTHFSTNNTDDTMIALIGTWARLNRIILNTDIKYSKFGVTK